MKNIHILPEEAALRQLFKNRSNCYADTWHSERGFMEEGEVVQAMNEDCFIDTIKEYQAKTMYSVEEIKSVMKISYGLKYFSEDRFFTNLRNLKKQQ